MYARILGIVTLSVATLAFATAAPPQIVWMDVVDIASGGGERGPWRQNESRYNYVDDPTVALDVSGDALVAWADQASKEVLLRRLSVGANERLGEPVNVSRDRATFSWLPRIALAPDAPQHVFVLWQEIIFTGGSHGGDILLARSADGGRSFSEPRNLSKRSLGGDGKGRVSRDYWHNGSLDIVAGGNGMLYLAWTEYDGPLWFTRSTDGGHSFLPVRQIAGDKTAPARAPALALDRNGILYLAWTIGEDETADIRVARSADAGASFGEPVIVARSDAYSDAPKVAVDANGVVHVVYGETSGGPLAPHRVHYTRSHDGARTFAPARAISDPLPQGARGAGFPALSIDAGNDIYVLWELFPNPRARSRGLGLAVSRDGGEKFTSPLVVPHSSDPAGGTNGSHQGLLMDKLAVRDGFVAIVNSSLKPNERSRVWLMRGELTASQARR